MELFSKNKSCMDIKKNLYRVGKSPTLPRRTLPSLNYAHVHVLQPTRLPEDQTVQWQSPALDAKVSCDSLCWEHNWLQYGLECQKQRGGGGDSTVDDDGLKLQVQLAGRLADKLRERGQTVRDVCKFMQHVDKLRGVRLPLDVVTKAEFHTVLRTFGVVETRKPFEYEAIFGTYDGNLLDSTEFLQLVTDISAAIPGSPNLSPTLSPATTFDSSILSTARAVEKVHVTAARKAKLEFEKKQRVDAATSKILTTLATKLYERRSGSLALTRAFQCVDTDSSGTIDIAEFAVAMGMFGFEPRESEIKNLFRAFGAGDHLEPIPYATFMHNIERFRNSHPLELPKADKKGQPDIILSHTCTLCGGCFQCRGTAPRVRTRCLCYPDSMCATCCLHVSKP